MDVLSEQFRRLNRQQNRAVKRRQNTVVLAGPGSGKTATLVVKAAYLLAEIIDAPRGLACITYNNEAAAEFRRRLESLGIKSSSRIFLGTVHSFCLNAIIRPLAPLVNSTAADLQVVGEAKASELLSKAAGQVGPEAHPYDLRETITRLRSRIMCGEDYSGFGDVDLEILDRYYRLLKSEKLLDFEGIVEQALDLVRKHKWARDLLAARFPWVLVDEYQDLGGPLHRIVEAMAAAGIRIFAVGDPDQSIYDFAGAEPAYLTSLSENANFGTVRLKFNYRSGQRLIAASQAALAPAEPRGYEPNPENQDQGEVLFFKGRSIDDHAKVIVDQVIPELVARKIPFEEIAIFYKRKGDFLNQLVVALKDSGAPFLLEKHDRYPRTRLTRWLQQAISAGLQLAKGEPTDIDLSEMESVYRSIRAEAGATESSLSLEDRIDLFEVVLGLGRAERSLGDGLEFVDRKLRLSATLSAARADLFGDQETWRVLKQETTPHGALAAYTLVEFSVDGRVEGKITLTTHHSSKGRQFTAVLIPELVQEVFPAAPWIEKKLKEERRLFYVAFTRAKKLVALVYGDTYTKRNGTAKQSGVSQFVREVHKRLQEES